MKRNPSRDDLLIKYKQLVCEYGTAVHDFQCKRESELIDSILRRSSQGNPSGGGGEFKPKRDSRI